MSKDQQRTSSELAQEAHQRWGETSAYKIAAERTRGYSEADWRHIKSEARAIYQGFSESRALPLEAQEVQRWVHAWRAHLDRYFYPCDQAMLLQLADLYESDERFQKNIDKLSEPGTALRMIEAIRSII